jgi:hypothetical protein
MAFSKCSFANVSVGTKIQLVEKSYAKSSGTFKAATDSSVTIFWTAHGKDLTLEHSKLWEVFLGVDKLKEDGTVVKGFEIFPDYSSAGNPDFIAGTDKKFHR